MCGPGLDNLGVEREVNQGHAAHRPTSKSRSQNMHNAMRIRPELWTQDRNIGARCALVVHREQPELPLDLRLLRRPPRLRRPRTRRHLTHLRRPLGHPGR